MGPCGFEIVLTVGRWKGGIPGWSEEEGVAQICGRLLVGHKTEDRENLPCFELGQMVLVSSTERKHIWRRTICGENDAFDLNCIEVLERISIWKCLEFRWEHLFLLISLDIFKHESRDYRVITPLFLWPTVIFSILLSPFPGWGDVGTFHSKSQALYRSIEDFSFRVTRPQRVCMWY